MELRSPDSLFQGGPGSVLFGYGFGMERFERFRFSVPTVPLQKGFSVFQYSLTGKVPVPVPVSVPGKRFRRFRFRFRFREKPGKSHPWTNTSVGGNFRKTFRTIGPYEFPQEKVWTNDWSI